MNLHILPDSKFSDRFYSNLVELGIERENNCIVRTNESTLKRVTHPIPYARFGSDAFSQLVGDTLQYNKVFIHQFSPLMYRWVAENKFQELNWCVWGADIYNLPGIAKEFYEPLTWKRHSRHTWWNDWQYLLKLYATNMYYQRRALNKVSNILTWMDGEFSYIVERLKMPHVSHQFFFYENDLPYEALDDIASSYHKQTRERQLLVLGNSGTDTNNHLDAIRTIQNHGVEADIVIPVSYGSENYKSFLRKSVDFYRGGSIRFMEEFLPFNDYIQLLLNSDGLIMNHLRPQGYGNILMMMYLEKTVYMNPRNISIPDLDSNRLPWIPISEVGRQAVLPKSMNAVRSVFSHERLKVVYGTLFS